MRVPVALVLALALGTAAFPSSPEGSFRAGDPLILLAERGILESIRDGRLRPVSRGEFVRWLVRAKGLPLNSGIRRPFPDVPQEMAPFVHAALAHGILNERGLFRPYAPLTRQDAVLWTVRALGHAWEAAALSDHPLPFEDLDRIPPLYRGAVAVALLSRPPLLPEPSSRRFHPQASITRAEGAFLIWTALQALENGTRLRVQHLLRPGILLTVEKRGALRTLPVWRVQVGAFASLQNAHRLAQEIRKRGLPVFVDLLDGLAKVRVGSFGSRLEAEPLRTRLAEEGYPTWIISTLRDFESLSGPQWMAILRVPRGSGRLRVALAQDRVVGRERTSTIARRSGAVAAVNGGYFTPEGDPLGGVMIEREWVSEPLPGRSCLGITDTQEVVFDTLEWKAEAVTGWGAIPIQGLNRTRGSDEVVLFTPRFGSSPRTRLRGVEVVVSGGIVQEVRETPPASVPSHGFVLSGHGAPGEPLTRLRPGEPVHVRIRAEPSSGDPRWQQVRDVLCGGPRLLRRAQPVPDPEGFPEAFLYRRHPRTAVGVDPDGTVILLVVDGRAPEHGLGMTIPELAAEMRRLGAVEALNLDGGGSTTLAVHGRVLNRPSDEAGERPVSDALLVLPP
ncbi:MAG: phosphodiester glycosidase family protein [Armatimonadota bacterium]|nr:phosphodiester glycosidase family protein [Armatimonadota bacterium]MDR7439738.1 phosphodiester glycosidase family protein [Armatimonadota bacterium]MDR7563091.1 phosphodiester glycosidase family protein [Armatimonadota bacterium]MDR7566949.1 phosphodiester glycosidase family protein [Armatimonadota bacterium]MDR7600993.1 phosphodiester glycosidase family protein [Armatimonadota bacterium]